MLPTPPASPSFPVCAPEDRLGLVLAGRLKLTGILGVGAYGVVYTARDVFSGRDYAVKALNTVGLDPRQQRFQQREIHLHHEASHHPNVVSLVQIMEADDCIYVVLEYCPEGDLFSSITEQSFYVGNDHLMKSAFLQVLDAVQFCHSIGIYHRDLKPENILVTDGGHTIKLADFGLATKDDITSDFGCGSTFYMSPECQTSTPSSQSWYASGPNDVWSLGVILVNLTCGRNPWKRASLEDATFRAYLKDPRFLSSILPISTELEVILRRIFECNPAKRISLPELRDLILRCDRFTAQPSRPITPPPVEYDPVYEQSFEQVVVCPPTPPPTPPVETEILVPEAPCYPSSVVARSPTPGPAFDRPVPSPTATISINKAALSPCQTTRLPAPMSQNFFCIPPVDPWNEQTAFQPLMHTIPCF